MVFYAWPNKSENLHSMWRLVSILYLTRLYPSFASFFIRYAISLKIVSGGGYIVRSKSVQIRRLAALA